jgi:hypothetical protein
VGLSLLFWAFGLLIAGAQVSVYLELASYFPNRSGGQAVYLAQAYPRPRYLVAIAFAVQALMLSFASSNAVVMAEYLYATAGHTSTAWEQKGLAVGCMSVIAASKYFGDFTLQRSEVNNTCQWFCSVPRFHTEYQMHLES